MWYIAAAAGVVLVGALSGFTRSRGNTSDKQLLPFDAISSASIQSQMVQALSMEEVDLLLAKLESEEPPDPVSGAMCYAPMAYPDSAEYICPLCGEKTVYSGSQITLVEWGLPGARRLGESINSSTEFNVVLDETLFCEFCCDSSDLDIDPALVLRVFHQDGSETVNTVSEFDLRMLFSFLQGRLFYMTSNDGQEPLRDHSDRIRQLLGIEEEI